MDLADLTSPALIDTALEGSDRNSVLRSLAVLVAKTGGVGEIEVLVERLKQREDIGSTGIGHGIAVPHCKVAKLEQVVMAIGVVQKAVAFDAIDGQPVRLFFAVVSPQERPAAHLQCLAAISRWAKDRERVADLLAAPTSEVLYALLPRSATVAERAVPNAHND